MGFGRRIDTGIWGIAPRSETAVCLERFVQHSSRFESTRMENCQQRASDTARLYNRKKMPLKSKTITPTSDFTVGSVLKLLASRGALTDLQVDEVRTGYSAKLAEIRRKLRTRESENPYVSPLELIAVFGFLSTDPRREFIDEVEISLAYSAAVGIPFSRIDPLKLDAKKLCSIVSKPFARKHLLVPIKLDGDQLIVALVNPFDRVAIQSLEDVTGFSIVPVLGLRIEILKTINEIFAFEHSLQKAEMLREATHDLGNLEQLVDIMSEDELDASDQHIVKAVDLLLQYAFEQRASDIHIEPKREKSLVRLRIDGRLHNTHAIPKQVYPSFLSRIKIMARMDIAEKRKPQDGRIKTVFKDMEIELRVSTIPVAFGEKLVIRIFDPAILVQDLSTLGFFPEQQAVFERMIERPHGIILVTGPTGSGKTTTLYSSLQRLARPEVNITTIEEPIEMVHEPFNQIGIFEQSGVTFAGALRSILRQDPDIIMVGEIRDGETAQYAVQAALTGHLVFSTLHTNNAVGAITRLADLGVEPYLIASTVIGVIAQRLLRMVCRNCDEPASVSDDEAFLLGVPANADLSRVRKGSGCEKCRKTGYRGRTAVYEMLEITDRTRVMIRDRADDDAVTALARESGMEPLIISAVRKLLGGLTTTEEILRVVPLSY
jgi:general secretion pathway protein E